MNFLFVCLSLCFIVIYFKLPHTTEQHTMDFGSKFVLLRLDETIFVPDFEKKLEEGVVQVAQKSNNIQSRYENGETCLLDILDTVSRLGI